VTPRAISAVAYLLAGPPLLDRSKGRHQTKRDTKTDDGSSVISSGLKHRANDAGYGSSSYSNRREQSGLNGYCVESKWKNYHIVIFPGWSFFKTEISWMRDASSGDKIIRR